MTNHDDQSLQMLFATTMGLPYHSATYTCITEFTDSFPKGEIKQYTETFPKKEQPDYIPEAQYPRIYTKSYKKSILTVL